MNSSTSLDDAYALLRHVQASSSDSKIKLGARGPCRFCGRTGRNNFRKEAHTFPISLGNRWVVSLDECDICNEQVFSRYEDALAKAVGPVLTLGGTRGRSGKVRSSGRSTAPVTIRRRHHAESNPELSVTAPLDDPRLFISANRKTGDLRLPILTPPEAFVPQYAYKALAKMAYAMLPTEDLSHYSKLRAWLIDEAKLLDFPFLEVGVSFGSVGNAPEMVAGTLLRRRNNGDPLPYTIFIFCAGSVCLQIELMSDHLEDHLPPMRPGQVKINFSVIIADDDDRNPITIEYGAPQLVTWHASKPQPSFIESVVMDFNIRSSEGELTPILRRSMTLPG